MIRSRPRFHSTSYLFSATLLALALIFTISACLKRARNAHLPNSPQANDQQSASLQKTNQLVNLNTASARELETLPGIGKGLADRIVEHRQRYGPFRRPEHLIIVRGISDNRFRGLRDLITVE